jgi:hypothetical protein
MKCPKCESTEVVHEHHELEGSTHSAAHHAVHGAHQAFHGGHPALLLVASAFWLFGKAVQAVEKKKQKCMKCHHVF